MSSKKGLKMSKILVKNPIVDINGDEMARIMWDKIKKELILPFLEIKLLEYDLGIKNRDKTNDKVTIEALMLLKRIRLVLNVQLLHQMIKE